VAVAMYVSLQIYHFILFTHLFQVDAIALHWYGTDPQAFISYVQDFHNTFNKNIWVTEFACQVRILLVTFILSTQVPS